jgi:uncharacterized glyoxalase superfamily protein PhnB
MASQKLKINTGKPSKGFKVPFIISTLLENERMKIEHLALMLAEPTKMANWYGKHLGLKALVKFDVKEETHFLVDDAGQTVLEIYNNHKFKVPDYASMSPAHLHLAFHSDDLMHDFTRLVDAGATVVDEPSTTELGDQFAMLRDPWGLPLQLVNRAKPLMES